MVDKVILINTRGDSYTSLAFDSAQKSVSLQTIVAGLKENGFDNISLVPHNTLPPVLDEISITPQLESIAYELIESSKGCDNIIFGISTTTDDYFKLESISRVIRKLFPTSKIVGGGPHFVREEIITSNGKKVRDPVQIALEDKSVDAVVVGDAQPFIDLVIQNKGDITATHSHGFYRLGDTGNVLGGGRGKYPILELIPYAFERVPHAPGNYYYTDKYDKLPKTIDEITIMLNILCKNGCDFCSIRNTAPLLNPDKAIKTLETILTRDRITSLHISDNSPLTPETLDGYRRIFEYTDNKNSSVLKSMYLDPSTLIDGAHFDKVMKVIANHHIFGFLLGRDCLTEENASIIGTKYKGKIRTQERLDNEQKAIINFIDFIQGVDTISRYKTIQSVKIFYIFNPFQTEQSILDTIDEMEYFTNLSQKGTEVRTMITVLTPYPGTHVRKKYIDFIEGDPEDFLKYSFFSNCWDPKKIGPCVSVLDHLMLLDLKHRCKQQFTNKDYFTLMRDITIDGFSGKLGDKLNGYFRHFNW